MNQNAQHLVNLNQIVDNIDIRITELEEKNNDYEEEINEKYRRLDNYEEDRNKLNNIIDNTNIRNLIIMKQEYQL